VSLKRKEVFPLTEILKVQSLKKYFSVRDGSFWGRKTVKAVDGIDFVINRGETFGLVGESGCGKSTLGRTILRLYDVTEGHIEFNQHDITYLNEKELIPYRKKMQMIFQDPYASLNPRMTVGDIIKEPMIIHKLFDEKDREDRVQYLIEMVGLKPDHIRRYPHEFSGGQRQRIGIARALAVEPDFIMCDEPISALDVSIQAQIINMLEELQQAMNLSYLFVAHDLSMVKHISNRVGVMYLGNLVECGLTNELYHEPMHPYTKALLSSIPIPDPIQAKNASRVILKGELPSPINPPRGCPFVTRCSYVKKICHEQKPELIEMNGRKIACHLYH
jgi:oligopeptide transport system ATP-binding protein